MRTIEEINQEYSKVVQAYGDMLFRQILAEGQISNLETKLKDLDREAAEAIRAKAAEVVTAEVVTAEVVTPEVLPVA